MNGVCHAGTNAPTLAILVAAEVNCGVEVLRNDRGARKIRARRSRCSKRVEARIREEKKIKNAHN